jgi:hypothetical protein
MSVELFTITRYQPTEVTPSRLGLGTAPYVWPDADQVHGWAYDNCGIRIAVHPYARLLELFPEVCEIAPAGANSYLALGTSWYPEGFEYTMASALGGVSTNDIELNEGPYIDEDHPRDPPAWSEPEQRAIRTARAALFADRYRPEPALFRPMFELASSGDLGASAVLDMWVKRGLARIHGETESRVADADFIRTAVSKLPELSPELSQVLLLR